jgi:DHA1 family tetracycline resistance protein-like MFS transporter
LVLAFAQSLWMLFLGRIIDGLTAGNITVAQAFISDVTPPEGRVKAYGLIGVSFGLGFLLGPAISGFLVGYGMNAPIFAAAALSFLSILGTLFLLPNLPPAADTQIEKGFLIPLKTWKRLFAHATLSPLLIQFFLFNWIFTSFTSGFALFAERRFKFQGQPFGAREVGYVLACMGLYGVLLQGGIIGRLNKKWGEKKLALVGFLTSVIGYVVLTETFSSQVLAFALLFTAFGSSVLRPALTSLLSRAVDKTEQGLVMGVSQSLGSIAQVLAPVIVGLLIEHDHLQLWALMMALISAFALWMNRRVKETI